MLNHFYIVVVVVDKYRSIKREDTYNKWYETKLEKAKRELEDAKRLKQDEEEKNAQVKDYQV